ncbi:MAG: hypothetical protein IT178_06345 [Acidobacteria bacterium]|nr:hypothetical protein [Acidobacteriota bacterium]
MTQDSHWALVADVVSARVLAWMATRQPGAELTPDVHLYFYDRYQRLAQWHQQHGHAARARQLLAKAEAHWPSGGGDGPPYAAAMAMPRPTRWTCTDAVSRQSLDGPDEAA